MIVYEKKIWVSKSIELDRYEPRLFCSVNLHWLLSLFVEKIHCCTYNSFFSFVLFCLFMFYCIAGMGYKVYDLFIYLVWKDLGHILLRSCWGSLNINVFFFLNSVSKSIFQHTSIYKMVVKKQNCSVKKTVTAMKEIQRKLRKYFYEVLGQWLSSGT